MIWSSLMKYPWLILNCWPDWWWRLNLTANWSCLVIMNSCLQWRPVPFFPISVLLSKRNRGVLRSRINVSLNLPGPWLNLLVLRSFVFLPSIFPLQWQDCIKATVLKRLAGSERWRRISTVRRWNPTCLSMKKCSMIQTTVRVLNSSGLLTVKSMPVMENLSSTFSRRSLNGLLISPFR